MIYKISLSISGDHFWPESIINRLVGSFIIKSQYNPTDRKFENSDDLYGYGGMLFWHPKEFALQDRVSEYEMAFVEFIETNYSIFAENNAEDFQMFIEIYYEGSQCNFEIFNKDLLKKLASFCVSIPISVYQLEESEINQWKNEIDLKWQN